MKHIKIWVYDGVMASGVNGPIDVFAVANALWANQNRDSQRIQALFSWRVESIDGKHVRTASGQTLHVDGAIDTTSDADAVIVLGPFVGGGAAKFVQKFEQLLPVLQPLLAATRSQHLRGATVCSVCSGSFLLAEAGLLGGRVATTHWCLAAAFRERFPLVNLRADEVLTEQGGVMCSGAVTSYFNLALRLVERFAGADLAVSTAKVLLIDTNRISQASYKTLTVRDQQEHADPLITRAQTWMEEHLREPFKLSDLARFLSVSERTVNRRFKLATGVPPLTFLQSMRMDIAKRLLETTEFNIDMIGERVGYVDVSAFRRLFKRETGLSPREYQHHFSNKKPRQPR